MTDRPIIFSTPMICALLAGSKTQTRRLLRGDIPAPPAMDAISRTNFPRHPAPYFDAYCGQKRTQANPRGMSDRWCWWTRDDRQCLPTVKIGYVPGDRLWVREGFVIVPRTAYAHSDGVEQTADPTDPDVAAIYRAGWDRSGSKQWKPSIHMPRWASRLTLTVSDVRVQRLQDISETDAAAEGVSWPEGKQAEYTAKWGYPQTAAAAYADLWDSLHGPGAWDANPWVVALTFTVERGNIDRLANGLRCE